MELHHPPSLTTTRPTNTNINHAQPLRTTQAKELGKPFLGQLRTAIQSQKNSFISDEVWENKRDMFLAAEPSIEQALQAGWKSTDQATVRAEARVGHAAEKLAEAQSRIRDAGWIAMRYVPDDPSSTTVFRNSLREVARAIREYFHDITEHPIRVTIKQLVDAGEDEDGNVHMGVQDYARDRPDDVRLEETDLVEENTDFSAIFINKAPYFHTNKLSQYDGYENSHYPHGPYPYESVIVWPIRKIYEDENDRAYLNAKGTSDFLGFLCVDSNQPDAFSRHDIWLVGVFAEALYLPLRLWNYEELFPGDDE